MSNPPGPHFQVFRIASAELELAVVPELGGKILSLIDAVSGRDWMWTPPDQRGLFRNLPTDPFPLSTIAGADECFPTVAACRWKGRDLPDHGELWAIPWRVLSATENALELEVRAPTSPFVVRRTITIVGACADFKYRVWNVGDTEESFLWALHPLLQFEPGDFLQLPASGGRVDSQINTGLGGRGAALAFPKPAAGLQLDQLNLGPRGPAAVKFFTDSLSEGRAALCRPALGRRLVFEFDLGFLNTIGVWINTGGWAGFRHVAIEPTNGAPDPLDVAASWNRCSRLDPGQSVSWELKVRIEDLPHP